MAGAAAVAHRSCGQSHPRPRQPPQHAQRSEGRSATCAPHAAQTRLFARHPQVRIFPGAHGRRCALLRVQKGMVEEVPYVDLRVAGALHPHLLPARA